MDTQEAIRILRSDSGLRKDFAITSLRLFGSLVRGEAGSDSDVDILVEFAPDARIGLFEFAQLQQRLSELLNRQVDLVTPDALHEALRERILNEAVYAA